MIRRVLVLEQRPPSSRNNVFPTFDVRFFSTYARGEKRVAREESDR